MFGIGLPEMLLIMALALIVVGPDKLPDLARSLAKGIMELKKTAESLKGSFAAQDNPLNEIRPELEEAANSLKNNLLDVPPYTRDSHTLPPAEKAAEAYQELLKQTSETPEIPVDNTVGDAAQMPLPQQLAAENGQEPSEPKKTEQ